MFAEYNYEKYNREEDRIVTVKFNETIESEEEFDSFLQAWLILYYNRKDYQFIFDTREMGVISLKYSIKMALFIKNLRKERYHYLQSSLILVNNEKIKKLLDFIFMMQSPVAPVYLWMTDEKDEDKIEKKCIGCTFENLSEDTVYVKPNQSMIPFL